MVGRHASEQVVVIVGMGRQYRNIAFNHLVDLKASLGRAAVNAKTAFTRLAQNR